MVTVSPELKAASILTTGRAADMIYNEKMTGDETETQKTPERV